jgi:hypothetical protein
MISVVVAPASASREFSPNAVGCVDTSLNAANGRFVSAELNYPGGRNGMLRARATAVGPWERFTICNQGPFWTIFSTANNRYVSAELGYSGGDNGMLRARATAIGPWEHFTFLGACGGGCVIIRSQANDRLVSAELGYSGGDNGMLRARSTAVGPWEQYTES